MKKLLLDTNIIIDLLAKRDPYYNDAAAIFTLADRGAVKLYISALSVANVHYILIRQLRPEAAKQVLRNLCLVADVLPLNEKIIEISLNDTDFNDFEDALQHYSALEYKIDIIITRNLKDFKYSKISVLNASQYVKTLGL